MKISDLQPSSVWYWFSQICAIPHPSYHEQKLYEFVINFAKERNLEFHTDTNGNILIRKPASKGREKSPIMALQAHLDMVAQANIGYEHNFLTDPIKIYAENGWVKATNTTLGADNGLGLASCLAVLDDNSLSHPELEVLITSNEEVGMLGVSAMPNNWLKAKYLINTDTDEEGKIYIGCAGGVDVNIDLPVTFEKTQGEILELKVAGLSGGHSGCSIHKNKANAVKLLAQILNYLQISEINFNLINVKGGTAHNAIPREAVALIATTNTTELQNKIAEFTKELQTAWQIAEPNLTITINSQSNDLMFDKVSTNKVIALLLNLPNGVVRFSDVVENVVETSLSIGIVKTDETSLKIKILLRSLNEFGKTQIVQVLTNLVDLCSAKVEFVNNYPGWQPDPNSQISKLAKEVYDRLLPAPSKLAVIHAGLECGIIKSLYPDLEIVAIGPTIHHAHSPDEKVNIASVAIYWQLLTGILEKI